MKGDTSSRIKSSLLLLSEILFIVTSAIWNTIDPDSKWLSSLYAILFCAGGYVLASSRGWLIAYCLLMVPSIVLPVFNGNVIFTVVNLACLSGAFILLFRAISFHTLFRSDVPHVDRLLAGIAGYILLGIFWAVQFGWAFVFDSGAYMRVASSEVATGSDLLYFSFMTLTTVGYGDIIPVTPLAKISVIFNSLSGVLYLAIFISSLVGNSRKQIESD